MSAVGVSGGVERPLPQDPRLAARVREFRRQAYAFESIFWNMAMQAMRRTVKEPPYFGGGFAEQVWTQMLDLELAARAAERGGGRGFADLLIRRLEPYVLRFYQQHAGA
jgi:Rod binding domain-containing protein